ncbi:MAG: arginine--tRNA ligase [Casimicrobiaceae bacterium]
MPDAGDTPAELLRPRDPAHGDFATNVAMVAAKRQRRNPRELAQAIVAALPASPLVARTDIAGAGFINIVLTAAARQAVVVRVLAEGDRYGFAATHAGERVMVEFVSANPTGPLHVGHGRQAVLGDAISSLLEAQGYAVTREFYYNDAGAQIENLALSVQARARALAGIDAPFPEDGYRGEYIRELAQRYVADEKGDIADLAAIRRFAVAALRDEQDADLRALGVRFDNYYLESSLYADGRVERTVAALTATGRTYEEGGALWLSTTAFGDDKDRVMRKSDGSYTYFVPDVAYHVTKFERGFGKAINVQGSDHHSTVVRVRAGLQALAMGIPAGYPDYVLHKMVTVMKGGEEVKISKRAGSYVTIRDLIDEVGRDAVRYFLVSRKADSEFTFDIDLARSQSDDNPVYYVQYAHARVAAVLRQAGIAFHDAIGHVAGADLALLTSPYEDALLRRLDDYPQEVSDSARELAPHRITSWLKGLSQEFHSYYNAERFLVEDAALQRARLALVVATGQAIRNGLTLLGIAAPLEM